MDKFLGIFATPLGYLLSFIYSVVPYYAITIIIFTIIVRGALFPLYFHQQKGMLKMSGIQPKIKALQQKFKGDKEELNKRMMELYKAEGYNPASGCLPLLIQMPILMGLFFLLRNPSVFLHTDKIIMATHESFLWMHDLGQPDPWILPILAGLTTFATFTLSQMGAVQMPGQENQTNGMMKVMRYVFPLLIFWMAKSMPAGLSIYWVTGNVFTMVQTRYFNVWKKKQLKKKQIS